MKRRRTRSMYDRYPAELHQLLRLGNDAGGLLPVGIEPLRKHVPALIEMMTDVTLHELAREVPCAWAPLHALRVLSWLGVPEAMAPALGLLEPLRLLGRDEFGWEVQYLGMAGLEVLPTVEAYLSDPKVHVDSRILASGALGAMTMEIGGPEEQPCIDAIRRLLALGSGIPEELRTVLEDRLTTLEDPFHGLDPDCPLCRMMIEGE